MNVALPTPVYMDPVPTMMALIPVRVTMDILELTVIQVRHEGSTVIDLNQNLKNQRCFNLKPVFV